MTLDPRLHDAAARTSTSLYTYDAAIGGTAPRWNDNCPDPPGAERDGCVVTGRVSKILPGRLRAAADQGRVVPAVPEPLARRPRSSAPTARSTSTAGDGASYTFADYGQDGVAGQPVRRPAGAPSAAHMTPPTAEGGALRSQDARTTGDPTGARRRDAARRPRHRRPAAGQPRHRRRRQRAPDRRLRLAQPVPLRLPPGHRPTLYVGDVGWLHVGGDRPRPGHDRRRSATTAGRATRATGRQSGYEAIGLNICKNLYTAGTARSRAALHLQPRRRRSPTEDCPAGTLVDLRRRVLRRRDLPARLPARMFFADYARNCIWVMFPDADGVPEPGHAPGLRRRRAHPGRPRDRARTATSTTPTSAAARSAASARSTRTRRRPRAFTATPTSGRRAAARSHFDATRLDRPQRRPAHLRLGPRRRRRLRRLDGGHADAHVHQRGQVTVRLRVTDPRGLDATPSTIELDGRHAARRRRSPRPADGTHLARRRPRSTFSGSARRADGDASPADALRGRSTCTTARRSCRRAATCTTSRTTSASRSGSFTLPRPRVPVVHRR